jgi:hypothetical protein
MAWCKATPVLLDCPPGDLCQRAYQGHKRGCPNYRKRPTCPPLAERWTPDSIALYEWYVVWVAFEFGAHVERMRVAHPDWSQRQLECCLYWQGTARKRLRDAVEGFLSEGNIAQVGAVYYTPEAHGCNVSTTMAHLGVKLHWPPTIETRHVALVRLKKLHRGNPAAARDRRSS